MRKYWYLIITFIFLIIVICRMLKLIDPESNIMLIASLLYAGTGVLYIYLNNKRKKQKTQTYGKLEKSLWRVIVGIISFVLLTLVVVGLSLFCNGHNF